MADLTAQIYAKTVAKELLDSYPDAIGVDVVCHSIPRKETGVYESKVVIHVERRIKRAEP